MPCRGYYSTTADQVRSLKAELKEGMAGFEAVGRFIQMVDNLVVEFNKISDGSTIKTDPGNQTGALLLVGDKGTGTKVHEEHGGALTGCFLCLGLRDSQSTSSLEVMYNPATYS